MWEYCGCVLMNSHTSYPLRPGMKMSARTRSKDSSRSFLSASSPLPTVTTSIPSSVNVKFTTFWIVMLSSVAGLIISYHANLPSGPAVILAAGFIYLLSLAIGNNGGLLRRYIRRPHLEH